LHTFAAAVRSFFANNVNLLVASSDCELGGWLLFVSLAALMETREQF
jgi:hypothetical protein